MTLKQLIWAGAAAYASYQLISRRKKIALGLKETQATVDKVEKSWSNIQKRLDLIQQQLPAVEKAGADLAYKIRVFEEESRAHLAQMSNRQN